MTSKFNIDNRELLQKISCGEAVVGIDFGNLIVRELAAFRLAAMDSEPVFTLQVSQADYKGQKLGNQFGFVTLDTARELDEGNYQLYAAQPAPVENHIGSKNALDAIVSFIKSKGNPTVKCYEEVSDQLFKDNCHGIHSHVIEYILKLGEELEDLRAEQDESQLAAVVPDEIKHRIGGLDWGWEGEFNRGWNACRAAMLAAAPQEVR